MRGTFSGQLSCMQLKRISNLNLRIRIEKDILL